MKEEKHKFRLEDLDKHNVFSTPDRYFEDLPMRIQRRTNAETKRKRVFIPRQALRWAVPALIVVLGALYYLLPTETETIAPEQLIAEVSTEDLVQYLQTSDMTTDDLIYHIAEGDVSVDFGLNEVDFLDESEIEQEDLDMLLNEYSWESEYL